MSRRCCQGVAVMFLWTAACGSGRVGGMNDAAVLHLLAERNRPLDTYFLTLHFDVGMDGLPVFATRLASLRARGLLASVRRPLLLHGCSVVVWSLTPAGREAVGR